MNELRQTKEYKLSDQGGEYAAGGSVLSSTCFHNIMHGAPHKGAEPQPFDPSKYDGDIPEEIEEVRNKLNYTLNEQMQEIAGIVAPTIHDVIFNEIIEVMDNYDELNWGYFVQDDAPTALLDACFDHKTEIHYEIFQLVLQKLK